MPLYCGPGEILVLFAPKPIQDICFACLYVNKPKLTKLLPATFLLANYSVSKLLFLKPNVIANCPSRYPKDLIGASPPPNQMKNHKVESRMWLQLTTSFANESFMVLNNQVLLGLWY